MPEFQKRFGLIAVEKGFITAEQLVEAFKVQVLEEIEKGKHNASSYKYNRENDN